MTFKGERALERRYRLLLALYPAAYRDVNEDEMLGVAMARSAEGQRWPRLGEAASFVWSGIGKRLGADAVRNGLRDQGWRDACAVLTIVCPIVLAAAAARSLGFSAFGLPGVDPVTRALGETAGWLLLAEIAGWLLVGIAATLGLRRIVAVGALAGLAAEIVRFEGVVPFTMVTDWWALVVAATTAFAALVALGGERRRVVSWRAATAIIAALALPAGWPFIETALTTWTIHSDGSGFSSNPVQGIEGVLDIGLRAVAGIVVLVVIARLRPAVRRRVVVALLPGVAVYVVILTTFNGFLASTVRFTSPVLLTPPQLVALIAVPLACFGLGLLWLIRYERMLNRVAREGVTS